MSKIEDDIKKCNVLIERLVKMRDALVEESATEELNKGLGAGWSGKVNKDQNMVSFSHGNHGVVSVLKNPNTNMFEVKHNGGYAGVKGQKGIFPEPSAALAHAQSYMQGLNTGKIAPKPLVNIPSSESMNLKPKAIVDAAAARMAAPKMPLGFKKALTPAQQAAQEEAQRLKKSFEEGAWNRHAPVPHAETELAKLAKKNPAVAGEDALANQLAGMMQSKAMMRPDHRQPTSEDMIMAGERMGLGANPELVKSADQQWGGAINNWLAEACKPISSRFSSPEEEEAYWSGIKVSDRDDGKSGY